MYLLIFSCNLFKKTNCLLQLTGIVGAVLRSAEPPASLDSFSLSRSSALRARTAHRPAAAKAIREKFTSPAYCVVHWDGVMIDVSHHHF